MSDTDRLVGDPILRGRRIEGSLSARVSIDGESYVNFFGSGYLALSNLPEIRTPVALALEQGVPFSRQVARLLRAHDRYFDEVESMAARLTGTETSVYFASGCLVGQVALASVRGSFSCLLVDECAHYNLGDAAAIAQVPVHRFAHCNPESLKDVVEQELKSGDRPALLTDGVFATTGRLAPLGDYASILARFNGRLVVDESHAFGVVGKQGRGASEHCGVEGVSSTASTLSKAFCAQGAVFGCSRHTAERLVTEPPLRGANAGSPLSAVASTSALRYALEHPELRDHLREVGNYLRARLKAVGYEVSDSPAPIVTFACGRRQDMLHLQHRAFEAGVYIQYSTYLGAGPEGMLRCAVFADHSLNDVDRLIHALE